MAHRYIELKIPNGMTIQLHASGIWYIILDETKIVELRDWAAQYTNYLTAQTLEYVDKRKKQEAEKILERQMRVRRISGETDELIKIEDRISSEKFEALAPTLPAPMPLVEYPPNRIVNTDKGKLEVAFDVTEQELKDLGYILLPEPEVFNSDNTETTSSLSASHTP